MSELQTDACLLTAQGASAEAAFSELIRRHQDFVFRVAFSQTGDMHAAEEVAQETFLRLAGGMARPDPKRADPFRAWLYVMVTNLARGRNRRERRLKQRHANLGALAGDGLLTEETSVAERQELHAALAAALGGLSRELRELIVLHYLEGFSQVEMSRMTGVSQSSISRRLDEGLGLLRKQLAGAGLAVSVAALPEYLKDPALLQAPAAMGEALAGACARAAAQAGRQVARSSLRVAAYTHWVWRAGVVVCSLAAVAGALWFISGSTPSAPNVAQPAALPAPATSYFKRWDFNAPEQIQQLLGATGDMEFVPGAGPSGTGCVRNLQQPLVLDMQDVPMDRLPLRVRIKYKIAVVPQSGVETRVVCNWSDASLRVFAPIRNVGVLSTFAANAIPWNQIDCYLTEDFIDEWLDGRRSGVMYTQLHARRGLMLAMQGTFLIDEIEIAQVALHEVPDLGDFRKAIAAIPPEHYTGRHLLPAFPSRREGKPVYVEFLRSPRMARDAQAAP